MRLAEEALDQHLLIVGATGTGKSEAIRRLVHEVLASTARDVILVDGKGDPGLAADVRALVWQQRGRETPVFRLGYGPPGARYDGFRGEPGDLYNRLAAMLGVEEATGEARHYANINRNLLQLVARAPAGPPRSFEEVRARLGHELRWLKAAYRDDPDEADYLAGLHRREYGGLLHGLLPLARDFAGRIGPAGFALEDTPAAVFSLRTQSAGDTARQFLRFLLEDLKDYAGKRQRRPAALIVDEFAAFGQRNIVDLLALARSARLGVVLAAQDVAGLGARETRQLILANTRSKLLLATEHPEEVAKLAGTVFQLEASLQHEEGRPTGLGTVRPQHAFRVDLNDVGRLGRGGAYLIRQRHAAKLRISPVGPLPPAPPEPVPDDPEREAPLSEEGVEAALVETVSERPAPRGTAAPPATAPASPAPTAAKPQRPRVIKPEF